MNNGNAMNSTGSLELEVLLPSGRSCWATVQPTTLGTELVDRLIERGRIEPGQYVFLVHGRIRVDVRKPVGGLFWPGETSARVELWRIDGDGPERPDHYEHMQVLYGCPTAVTPQAEQLVGCTVTREKL